jgi:hypothetical protein
LSNLESEKTHELWLDLEDGAGKIFLLVTISGKTYGSDLSDESGSKISEELVKKYSLKCSMMSSNFFDVGFLEVKIYCAKGLYAADLVRMTCIFLQAVPKHARHIMSLCSPNHKHHSLTLKYLGDIIRLLFSSSNECL